MARKTAWIMMFEAIATVCLLADPGICRPTLLPGYEAESRAGCEARLAVDPPVLAETTSPPPVCAEAGEALPFDEVADGVFVHRGRIEEPDTENRGDVANIGFVIGSEGVAVIDAGSARWISEGVWRAIRERTRLPVRWLILTHMHPDHVLGTPLFVDAGAEVVGHVGLDRALADRAENYTESLTRLLGSETFIGSGFHATDTDVADTLELDLGGRLLKVQAWPPAHTGTDLTVLDQETDILFAGDLVFDDHVPALDGKLRGWQTVMDDLAEMKLAGVVPGHGGPLLKWPDGAEPMRRYLKVLAEDTRLALDAGVRLGTAAETIARSEAPQWELFDAYNARNATVAYTELEWE